MMNKIIRDAQAVVFDMDGLLLDTERICYEVLTGVFNEHGFELTRSEYINLIGLNAKEVRLRIARKLGDNIDHEKFISIWKERYHVKTVDQPAPVKEGVRDLIKYFRSVGKPLAVATSTDRELAERKLRKVDLFDHFSSVVGGNQIERSKPAPDIYLEAARALKVLPENCLAFEDSMYGLEAALSAGMQTIHIPDMVPVSLDILNKCVGVYESCDELLELYCEAES